MGVRETANYGLFRILQAVAGSVGGGGGDHEVMHQGRTSSDHTAGRSLCLLPGVWI